MAVDTGPRHRIIHFKTYANYVKYRKWKQIPKHVYAHGRDELYEILGSICQSIAENLVESEAGVLIKDWGYFFVWMSPRKRPYRKYIRGLGWRSFYNTWTENYMYHLVFMPKEGSWFDGWSMDSSFNRQSRLGVYYRIRSGFRYKAYPYTLQDFL